MTQRSDLGVHYLLRGEYDRAVRSFLDVIREDPEDAAAWSYYGISLAHIGRAAEAEAALARAIELAPANGEAWFHLGVARSQSGEEPGASVAFERALVLSRALPSDENEIPAPPRLDDHVEEAGAREGAREAKSWLDLALSLLSLGDEDAAVAAYERAYTLDAPRAQNSLFRPMLRLLTAVEGGPDLGEAESSTPPRPRARADATRPEVR